MQNWVVALRLINHPACGKSDKWSGAITIEKPDLTISGAQ